MNNLDITNSKYIERVKVPGMFFHEGGVCLIDYNGVTKAYKKLPDKNLKQENALYRNKLYTVQELIKYKEHLNRANLICPSALASVDGEIAGFISPYVKSVNLKTLLDEETIDIKEKIGYLKQVGKILRNLEDLRKVNGLENLYLNDIHEGNFIVDESGIVKVVDLDSCRIGINYPMIAKYLTSFSPLKEFPYKYDRDFPISLGGEYEANKNSDLYCYTIMTLNLFEYLLYGCKSWLLPKIEFEYFLNKLLECGANKELIDVFSKVYTSDDNINFDYLLDYIPEFYARTREI